MKTCFVISSLLAAAALYPPLSNAAITSDAQAVALAQAPLVMRLNKDEFRIAFGLSAEHCAARGCSGVIRYRVDWKADDGTVRSEIKHLSYSVAPQSSRALAVDRQYFDTAEGAHTTEVLKVRVTSISCLPAAGAMPAPSVASSSSALRVESL